MVVIINLQAEQNNWKKIKEEFPLLFKKYELLVNDVSHRGGGIEEKFVHGDNNVIEVLNPLQIDHFLNATVEFADARAYKDHTGRFINRLVQNSYSYGYNYNEFILTTSSLPSLNDLCTYLRGTQKRKLEVNLAGNVGHHCGSYSRHLTLTVHGDVQEYFSNFSEHGIFTIHGEVWMENSGPAVDSTFKTTNLTTLIGMVENVDALTSRYWTGNTKRKEGTPSGNKVIFIHRDGSEEVVRNYVRT